MRRGRGWRDRGGGRGNQNNPNYEQNPKRPGDRICGNCNALNFSARTDCFKCHTPIPHSSQDGRGAHHNQGNRGAHHNQGNRGAHHNQGNRGAQHNQGNRGAHHNQGNRGAQHNQGNRGAHHNHGNRGNPHNQGNRGGPHNQGNRGGFHNQGNRGSPHNAGNRGGHNQGGPGAGPGSGQGWTCMQCQAFNYVNRMSCFKCNNPKGGLQKGDEQRLIQLLHKSKSPKKVIDQSMTVYLKAWKLCKQFKWFEVKTLIESFTKLPNSYCFETPPNPIDCRQAVDEYVDHFQTQRSHEDYAEDVIKEINILMNFVKRLLEVEWNEERELVKKQLNSILDKINNLIVRSNKEHRLKSEEIDKLLENIEHKTWTIKLKSNLETCRNQTSHVTSRREAASDISIWQNTTLEWLANPKHFQSAYLPVMKVPGDNKSMGVYKNKEDYFNTICKLWIGLTFSDGNEAINAKCRERSGEKECGMVMWSIEGTNETTNSSCSMCKIYGHQVTFVCPNKKHRYALCKKCARKIQTALMGPKGPHASTHVYDFRVHKVDFDNRIQLSNMRCRRPPQQSQIHWRSTSRLNVSCLVAIVKVAETDAPLRLSDKIVWAEIEAQRDMKDEFQYRERGQMVVSDLRDSKDECFLRNDDHVVVIDCKTFVPEHIPVLKALDELQISPLPFQEGAMLNLDRHNNVKSTIDFDQEFKNLKVNQVPLINLSEDDSDLSDDSNNDDDDDDNVTPSCTVLVDFIINASKLEPLVDIRRDQVMCQQLKDELERLVKGATLDREQLASFVQCLVEPVHLTQGPPGTGKSYLGVVIVRALMKIRRYWMSVTPSVGNPPILVLSYKNHAIDEFLVDLVNAEGSGRMQDDLVRIGSSQEYKLAPYLEKNQRNFQYEIGAIKANLRRLHDQKTDYHSRKQGLSPLSNFEALKDKPGMDEDEERDKKKAHNDCTIYLCQMIKRIHKMEAFFNDENKPKGEEDDVQSNADSLYSSSSESNKEKNTTDLWDELFSNESLQGVDLSMSDIAKLCEYIQHYKISIPEIIYQWINGFRPKPKCKTDDCMSTVFTNNYKFCDKHLCLFNKDVSPTERCKFPRLTEHLCAQHACQYEECTGVKLLDPQIYCNEHACFVCIRENKIAQKSEDEPPRNTCLDHVLCAGLTDNSSCQNLAVNRTPFCLDHAFPICRSKDKNGKACKNYASSRGVAFCDLHKPKPVAQPKQVKQAKNCKAITTKNKPCKGVPLIGFEYCKNHLGQAETTTSTSDDNWEQNSPEKAMSQGKFNPISLPTQQEESLKESDEPEINNERLEKQDLATDEQEEENDSEDDDFEDAITGQEAFPDEDQQPADDDYDCGEDQYNHLRDVHGVESRDAEEMSEPESEVDEVYIDAEEEIVETFIPVTEWTWELNIEERWTQAHLLEQKYKVLLARINEKRNLEIEVARKEFHKAKVRAKSKVYEGKAIIGGTIVGCIGRLESIRKIKPFAILVEEASEVLEPLLFSCLGEDTVKFEMIGDHLQLKPSIMSKIAFERRNKINVSMFERLINAPDDFKVPSNCLSIQRRMRRNICDLTREFYEDIVEIEDHEQCNIKKIGDKLPPVPRRSRQLGSKDPTARLKACVSKGREIPGVLPHIYFWTHTGAQTKAHVGVSRINKLEAEMVFNLTEYLVACGVPKPSIAIITPYKGQLMLMRKNMIQRKLLDTFNTHDSVRLSTVDRFQGDEADIVIISLVIDANSFTPFVKLCNRMVVLLSRARIGMYILGNIDYFLKKPDPQIDHWLRTIEKLGEPSQSDTDPTSVSEDPHELHYNGPRRGDELPICCPVHRENEKLAKRPSDLRLDFCDIKCTHGLKCSHPCNLDCHFQNIDNHNTVCAVKIVPPPCLEHHTQITCDDIYKNIGGKIPYGVYNIDEALKKYRCPALVNVQLPCQHQVDMPCADKRDIADKKAQYPECQQLAHNPYVYPDCCHELTVLCCVYAEYKQNPSRVPKCKEKLIYTPACGHSIKVDCFLKQQYEKKEVAFQCVEKVEVVLPRCGHDAVVSCDKEQQLRNWKGERCPPGLVREGQNYGPTDHRCDEMVDFERKCGHIEKLKCQEAFEQARSSGICNAEVQVVNPECGHEVMMKCHQKQLYTRRGILINRKPVQDVNEGLSASIFGKSVLHEKCQQAVTYIRKCGHQAQMKCCEARDEHVKACVKIINVQNKLCDHTTFLPCHLADEMNAWKPWPSGKSPLSGGVLSDAHEAPALPRDELARVAFNCSQAIKVEKSSCKHIFDMNCNAAMKNLGKNLANIKCKAELKQALLKCGHTQDFLCWQYEDYKQNPSQIQCKEKVFLTCWNHKACRQLLQSTCNMTGKLMQCKERTEWSCEKGHKIKDAICQRGLPSHCPECDAGNIEIHMETLKNLKQQKKGVALPDLPSGLKNLDPVEITNAKSESAFLDAQLQVLTALKSWTKNQKPTHRPTYTFSLIPCFRFEHNEHFRHNFDSYMKAGTMNGTQVLEWTLKNVEQMIKYLAKGKKRGIFLMFGIVFCSRVLVDPSDYPKKKNKPWEKQNWAIKQREQKYSAIQKEMDSYDALIVWDPYPMIATHKIWIKVSDLQKIASQMKNANPPVNRAQLAPKFLKFSIPEKACSYVVSQAEKEQLDDETNEAEEDQNEVVNDSWDGVSLGNSIGERAQKELVEKLQFCSKLSKSAGSDDPFSGLKCLKHFENNLKKGKKESPDIYLLKALEHQHMKNFDESNDDLSKYLEKLSEHERHPLSLIAHARQILHADKTSEDGRDILLRFANTFPQAVVNWLSEAEIALLKDEDESQEEATVVMTPLKRWEQMKQEEGVVSEEMDNLMKLTGLRKVKKSAFDIFKAAYKFSMLPPEVQKKNPKTLNFCFLGNAGSGKTTVARKLAAILKDSGARPAGTFVETSAQKLKDDGADEFRKLAKSAEGGVLFIDEAYDLDPKGDFKGKPIVSELLVIAENDRDKLSIILAGYEDDMNSKLFSFNEGIKSRFEMVNFEDFNEKELLSIWEGELKERNFQSDDRAGVVVSKRLHKCAGRKGFGNARAVRKEVEKAINICMGRDDFDPNHLFITIEDVMGESPLDNPKLKDVLREIDEKIGWTSIKKSVAELLEICKRNYEKQLLGRKTSPIMLNRLFLGNPGTGKTTCAELYGRLLKELGILSVGDVVMCAASDLVGSHVGESQKKTNEMIEKGRGKVLVIDEAYSLNDGMYGKQALDTIVEKVQNTESDDIAVLMLGYEKQMRQMLREQNPGLARRFSSDNPFIFVDYTQKELLDILNLVCKKENILLSSEVSEKIINLLEKQKSQANFGNAGAINNLIRVALQKAAMRPLTKDGFTRLLPEDIDTGEKKRDENVDPLSVLDKLYRMEKVKEQLIKIRNTFQVANDEGGEKPDLGHFVFRGAPGTGKTTVARAMADILYELGLIARNHVEETSGLDLTGDYVGQTKTKVQEKLDAARGGILFIDEAYELGKGIYGEEALTTILAAMTDPDYTLVIIIAGYPEDMENMLARNVGLKSRFTRYCDFPNWETKDCLEFLVNQAVKENFVMDVNSTPVINAGVSKIKSFPGWGNARDVKQLWKVIKEERADRVCNAPEQEKTISVDDVSKAVNKMVEDRAPKVSEEQLKEDREKQTLRKLEEQFKLMSKDKTQTKEEERTEVKIEEIQEEPEEEVEEEEDDADEGRDPGVPDDVWEELKRAKLKYAEEENQRRKQMEEIEKKMAQADDLERKLKGDEAVEAAMKEMHNEEEKKAQEEAELVRKLQEELANEREAEKQRQLQLELEERRRKEEELRRKLAEERERQRLEAERLERIRLQIELERKRAEAAARKQREEELKRQKIQERLQRLSPCPAGFTWGQVSGGWRCSAGGHFVSDAQLREQFTHNI